MTTMFQFRLQRVLELREKTEQEAAVRLAEARTEADAAHHAAAVLEAIREEGIEAISRGHATPRSAGQLQNASFLIEHLNRQLNEAHGVTEAAEANLHRKLIEFTAAFQERRVLDRLRDRQHEEWKADAVHADRQLMDGIALIRFARRAETANAGGEP
jgi:flagellar protein FliJ